MAPTRRSPPLVLLFTILTCGIYYYYWLYTTASDIRNFLGDADINPGMDVLLTIITCGLYQFYWYYKYNQKLMEMQDRAGMVQQDNYIVYVLLIIFGFSSIGGIIMQSQLNTVWDNTYYRQA